MNGSVFSKARYKWGRFRNTGSHTRTAITSKLATPTPNFPSLPSDPPPPRPPPPPRDGKSKNIAKELKQQIRFTSCFWSFIRIKAGGGECRGWEGGEGFDQSFFNFILFIYLFLLTVKRRFHCCSVFFLIFMSVIATLQLPCHCFYLMFSLCISGRQYKSSAASELSVYCFHKVPVQILRINNVTLSQCVQITRLADSVYAQNRQN